ncbi:SAM [Musa troglodytarum]|uniref:SAM n=1 Tax=Musa troglodytarum TaxID=320322 RepID=A0A9E7H784_9LILI|nr:SAM [Musa troglodytarum]
MYADQISAGRKRSIKERLHGDLGGDVGRSSVVAAKRQRQSDDKWKHDLYEDDRRPEASKSVDPTDLRWKLQKKGSQQGYQSGKASVVRDLRDKLSGTMQSQPPNIDPSKAKRVSELSGTIKKSLRHDPPKPEAKKLTDSTFGNPSQRKASDDTPPLSFLMGLILGFNKTQHFSNITTAFLCFDFSIIATTLVFLVMTLIILHSLSRW